MPIGLLKIDELNLKKKVLEWIKLLGDDLEELNFSFKEILLDDIKVITENCKNLKKLYFYNKSSLDNAMIALFPESLTDLIIAAETSQSILSVMHLSNLENLTLGKFPDLDDDALSLLPTSLTSLKINNSFSFTDDAISLLPKNLKSLILTDPFDVGSLGLSLSDTNVDFLPPNLEILHINSKLSEHKFNALPTSLLGLILEDKWYSTLSDLPPELMYLSLLISITDNELLNLPKKLESLVLHDCSQLSTTAVENLPTSLIALLLRKYENLTDQDVAKLPQNLKTLELKGCSSLTEDCIPYLPRLLEYLKIDDFEISDPVIKDLPSSLTNLVLNAQKKYLSASGIENLPSSLTKFKGAIISDAIAKLPRGLKKLSFSTNHLIDSDIANLPPDLNSLVIDSKSTTSDNMISFLPKKLKTLSIVSKISLSKKGLELLPLTLKKLKINKGMMWKKQAALLPRGLTALDVGSCYFMHESILHLPPRLTSLNNNVRVSSLYPGSFIESPENLQNFLRVKINENF